MFMSNARTALVIRPITRCEFGTESAGFLATAFDRVEILKSGTWSSGTRHYTVRNDAGETFQVTDHQVQED